MNEYTDLPSAERIQAFLEGELPAEEAARFQELLNSSVRLQEEVEGWQLLFAELGDLPVLGPSQGFAERVMHGVDLPSPVTLGSRIRGWFGSGAVVGSRAVAPAARTPTPELLQDFVDGTLRRRERAWVAAAVQADPGLEAQVRGWTRLFGEIGSLPRFAPAEGFAERVMARAPIRKPVTVAARTRRFVFPAWARNLWPSTGRGWAVVGGVASVPAVATAALAGLFLTNPLLTPTALASFLWWQASAAISGGLSWATASLLESAALFRAYSMIDFLAGSPAMVAGGASVFSALSVISVWVLYRNIISAQSVDGSYARISA